jgi:hypothetical protein
MPCGTGKSLTAFWIAEKLAAKTIVIAVPSLALVPQTLFDWVREYAARGHEATVHWLCVCSDQLSELRTSEFLVLRLRGLDDYVNMKKEAKVLGFHFVDPPSMQDHMDTGYKPFWDIVTSLDSVLERDDAKLERRLAP